jgi:hypothetical protein
MSYHLKDAIASVYGKSELADEIIKRRFGNLISESGEVDDTDLVVESASQDSLSDDDLDDILDDVITNKFIDTGKSATKKLMNVVLMLTEQIASLESIIDQANNEETEEDSEQEEKEKQVQLDAFRASLKGSRSGDLRLFYNRKMLETMRPNTRYLICRELVEYSASINKEPLNIWALLVYTHGVM